MRTERIPCILEELGQSRRKEKEFIQLHVYIRTRLEIAEHWATSP